MLLVGFFLASLPVCLMRPFYGVFLWTVVAFVNPQWYTWSAASALPWALVVAIPTMVGMLVFSGGWSRLSSRESLLLFAFWLWTCLTSVISTHTPVFVHHAGDTWYRWEFVSKILLMTFVTIVVIRDFRQFHVFLRILAGCFGIFVIKTLPFVILTAGQFRVYGPPNSMIADNNDFGLALNMTLPLFFFLAQVETNPWLKRLFWFLFLATIPSILFTYSRGAMVGLLALLGLMFLQLKQRLLLIPVMVIGLIGGLIFAPENWRNRMDPTRKDAVDLSAQSRLNAWTFAWNLASDFPLTGGGYATFTPELFHHYAPKVHDIHGAHSVYFQVLGEHGFPGLLLYLTLVFSSFRTTRTLVREARARGDLEVAHYANMLWFSMVGFLVSGLFLGRAYFDYYFSIVAALVVLKDVAMRDWAHNEAEETAENEETLEALPAGG